MNETILILDFGSQYTQLIARRVRELNVYCEIHPFNAFPSLTDNIKGVILSGSPFSVRDDDAPIPNLNGIRKRIPLLGVCYGAQFLAQCDGGEVLPSQIREYGRANLAEIDHSNPLVHNMPMGSQVWMSHGDTILHIPENYRIIASTSDVEVAGFAIADEPTWGIQFHPEVFHSTDGMLLLENFVVGVCKCNRSWTPDSFVESTVLALHQQLGNDKVVLGLSGGVDSSVAAMLLHKAIGRNLFCIFVDNGLLRKNEFSQVLDSYQHMGLNVKGIDAKDRFYSALEGKTDPEEKRKAIGKTFIDVFDQEAHALQDVKWLAQGTIYPDVIESISVKGPSATIKSHHNVGGLPDYMKLKVVEPLKSLFKDEVRRVGRTMKMSNTLLSRHPFPGPGLGIRILGAITPERVRVLQEVDDIFISELRNAGLYNEVWQALAVLLPVNSVGVMGDERTYENVVALRAVGSTDGMTADWSHLPYEFLAKVSNSIINKVKGVNRVVYDISSKPPATIEWE
ncbi:MAG: glutamine-hydrolyzing GMP synthase [Bacteroidales bacterium]|nr:glutamine-hydrolyzing GMP synthase [Bacteroidales bacterium]MDD3011057.1 glutamine-hydrolyzing GMP synthase [Bacteroidales bacterium]MDD3962176.1 glutamine-hydrolyzing GMP synthase [Bacteroidales bacterium]MDY0285520.1 glutamine-hydrolyzing GMP synthase [Bacteroidales bacterium]HPE87629.1 glutamine-hydrolyzing GMP synthase [Bacteroidales bacterium]